LPRNITGVVVALADKLETLVGLFGIGQLPTGDKDPFALRRHALGVIRILIEKDLDLNLQDLLRVSFGAFVILEGDVLLDAADSAFDGNARDARARLTDFIYERLAGSLREQAYSAQEVEAVLALRPVRLADVTARLAAVRAFAALPEAVSLAAANKRIANILKKSEAGALAAVDAKLLREDAERHLHGAMAGACPLADALFDNGEYAASLRELAVLKAPVDAFFDQVMVNAEDAALRANRLALLGALHAAMNRVADLSRLAA
jgi:glycyl-tRNA synthetase beta chain